MREGVKHDNCLFTFFVGKREYIDKKKDRR